jgi:hypothetical protein
VRANIGRQPGSVISSTEAWQNFCRDTGQTWVTQTDFSLFVQHRGHVIRKDGQGRMVIQDAGWLRQDG